jgi:hypothetical protein
MSQKMVGFAIQPQEFKSRGWNWMFVSMIWCTMVFVFLLEISPYNNIPGNIKIYVFRGRNNQYSGSIHRD